MRFLILLLSLLVAGQSFGRSAGVTIGDNMTSDFLVEACRGNIPGMSCVNKFGYNASVTSTEDIWDGGGAYTGHDPVAADTVHVFSSSTADDGEGTPLTGARTVQIYGLDGSHDLQDETITMNGTAAVASLGSYIRVFRVIVLTAGSGGANAGTITVRPSAVGAGDAADVFEVMIIGKNQSLIAVYTIPNGKTGFMFDWSATLAGNTSTNAVAELHARPDGGVYNVKEIYSIRAAGTSLMKHPYVLPKGPFAEKTDILVQGTATTGGSEISAGFSLLLIDN